MLDANHIDELVKKAAEFGGGKIHIIVNNAGEQIYKFLFLHYNGHRDHLSQARHRQVLSS